MKNRTMEENGPQLGCDRLSCQLFAGLCGLLSIEPYGIASSKMASTPRRVASAAYTAAQSVVECFPRIKCKPTTLNQWFHSMGLIIRCGWNTIETNYYNASTARLMDYRRSVRRAIRRKAWKNAGFGTNIGRMRK